MFEIQICIVQRRISVMYDAWYDAILYIYTEYNINVHRPHRVVVQCTYGVRAVQAEPMFLILVSFTNLFVSKKGSNLEKLKTQGPQN